MESDAETADTPKPPSGMRAMRNEKGNLLKIQNIRRDLRGRRSRLHLLMSGSSDVIKRVGEIKSCKRTFYWYTKAMFRFINLCIKDRD